MEEQLRQRRLAYEQGRLTLEQAYGELEEWIVKLGERRALLDPTCGQWLWEDRLHEAWEFASCGIEEALLISSGKVSGIKKLPAPGRVEAWCVYRLGKKLFGPLRLEEAGRRLLSGDMSRAAEFWSPCAADWLRFEKREGEAMAFSSPEGTRMWVEAGGVRFET
jgi:hypothetical protein